jgi:hypothetical protein
MKPDDEKECRGMTMCGNRCDLCKAYVKNVERRDERAELSRMWEKYYGLNIPPEDIVCDGCRSMKPDARRVDAGCPVRACVLAKGMSHCGNCAGYPCKTFGERAGLSAEEAERKAPDGFSAAEYACYLAAYDNLTRLNAYRKSPDHNGE